jgi:hypothetical protein
MGERIEYSKRERNISEELHKSWQSQRQRKDTKALMKYTGKSKPVIYAALNNGYVGDAALADKITEYFLHRPKEIKVSKKAQELIEKTKVEG